MVCLPFVEDGRKHLDAVASQGFVDDLSLALCEHSASAPFADAFGND
jgi:hypothetical protein